MIFGTQKPGEISHKWYLAYPQHLKNVTTVPLKDRCYQISIVSLKNWMHLK